MSAENRLQHNKSNVAPSARPLSTVSPVTAEAIHLLIQTWTAHRNLPAPFDLNQTFLDAGFDSLHLLELALYLEKKLDIPLGETLLYDHPTFMALTEYLVGRFAACGERPSNCTA